MNNPFKGSRGVPVYLRDVVLLLIEDYLARVRCRPTQRYWRRVRCNL